MKYTAVSQLTIVLHFANNRSPLTARVGGLGITPIIGVKSDVWVGHVESAACLSGELVAHRVTP